MKRLFAVCLGVGLLGRVGSAVVIPVKCNLFFNGSNAVQIAWNAYPGESYIIQTTTNLAQPWQSGATLTTASNAIYQSFPVTWTAQFFKVVKLELKAHFRPEFLNRVDDIIIFHNLDEKHLARIVDIQLQRLEKRLTQQQLTLEVDRSAKQLIGKEGFDPQFGARPLKRAIQDRLLDPLATKLLLGEFKPGDRIKVLARDGELEFAKK